MILGTGDSERLLISRAALDLAQQGRRFTLAARDVDDRLSDSALDAGEAFTREASALLDQLDRAKRKRPPRGGRSR